MAAPVHLTTAELAERLRTTPNAVRIMRSRGTGPAYIRRGNRPALYRLADVEAWERDQMAATP